MIKKTIIILCFLFATILTIAQGVQFQQELSWKDIQLKARAENKYILIDAYATWCEACKAMETQTFTQTSVAEMINANFVSVKVQMDRAANDNEFVRSWYTDAEMIAKQSKLTAYPTLLFFSPDGKLVHKTIGYKDAPGLIAEVKKALNPLTGFFVLVDKYKKNQLHTSQIKALAFQAKQMGDNETAWMVAQGYIKAIRKKEIYRKDNLIFIGQFLTGSSDPNFNIFFKKAKKVNEVVGKNFAENTVMGIIAKEEITPYDKSEKPDWDAMEKKIVSKYGALGEERIWGHRLIYYSSIKDWNNFGKYYKKYFDRAIPSERSFLHINNLSWSVFEHVNDQDVLETALKSMKYDIEKFDRNDVPAIDTYANLLYKVGNKQEAINWEQKAVLLSNYKREFVETLQKMKKNEKTW